ncbi:hypothetical protein [Curtanaerobium respiraculi]|uniref:hypothetical protein n=1 Tax=Curtanaerobium respiraculi TaxID=2949669 RepID=UPI0024B35121|nr:hypothetical protein [Curtanaerobium respiraculi]
MKRRYTLLALVMLGCCLALAGCGGGESNSAPTSSSSSVESPYIGKWTAVVAVILGENKPADQVYEKGFYIDVKPDGTCMVSTDGRESKFDWEKTDAGFKVKDLDFDLAVDGSTATMEVVGQTLVLTKDGAELPAAYAVKSKDPSASASANPQAQHAAPFIGTWDLYEIPGDTTHEDVERAKQEGWNAYVEIRSDGTMLIVASDESASGTWESSSDSKGTCMMDGAGFSEDLSIEGGKLVISNDQGDSSLVLEKRV